MEEKRAIDYCLLPIENYNLYKLFIEQQSVLWKQSEIHYNDIRDDWNNLTPTEQHITKNILALFAQLDNIVSQNISCNFINETDFKEAIAFYGLQNYVEIVHAYAYANMISECISDPIERVNLFESVKNYDSVFQITQWIKKYMKHDIAYLERIIAFICLEGVIFMFGFIFILWLKDKNKLIPIGIANEWILRDEKIHTDFGIELYKLTHGQKLEYEKVIEIFDSAINVAKAWVNETLPTKYENLCVDQIINYVKCIADEILEKLEYPKYYNVSHECYWMLKSPLNIKTNFFEKQVTTYSSSVNSKIEILDDF